MEEIYKINQLSFNDQKSQFCLCYNNGIKTFSTNDFVEKCSSNENEFSVGGISMASLLMELNIAVFVGTESNQLYSNKKLVVYDLISKKEICFTLFENKITSLRTITKYIIVTLQHELKIFSFTKSQLEIIKEITFTEPELELYEIWEKPDDISPKNFLALLCNKEIHINSYSVISNNKWSDDDKKIKIKNSFNKIQNMFYISKLKQLFVVDEFASYINSYDVETGKEITYLYRGKNPGFITSITLLNKVFLAVNNLNRTIHIFNLDINNNSFNLSNCVYGYFFGEQIINSYMKIYFDELIINKEGEFYDFDFQKKGAIISSDPEGIELNIIAYNGYAYKLRMNFIKKKYDVIKKSKYVSSKNSEIKEQSLKDEKVKGLSIYSSIFDKEEKNEDKKFIVYGGDNNS